MRKTIVSFMLLGLVAAACSKEPAGEGAFSGSGREIVLGLDDSSIDMSVDTKATAITSLSGTHYWGATTGTRGNTAETRKWNTATASVSSNKIATGKYQTATPTAYNYYVSNATFTVPATGNVTMSASNTTDVYVGWVAASNSTTPAITLNHIFARTGSLTATAPSGFTASNVSWKIVGTSTINGTAGTYNLSTGAWTAASTKLSSDTAITTSSDMYLIPGTYTITVSYTLTKGDNVQSYTKQGTVTLAAGKVNNISCTLVTTSVPEITLNLSLTAWGSQNLTLTLPS